jgi:hypothetical protein
MLKGRLQRLMVSVALVVLFGGGSHRPAAARAGRSSAGEGAASAPAALARRSHPQVDAGCRVLPEPAPETPPAAASCS